MMHCNKSYIPHCILALLLVAGCSKEMPNQPLANRQPKTFLWLFPDSTIAEGNSKQRVRWWGEDPDGVIRGYLFASGKIVVAGGVPQGVDTLTWRWVTSNDTFLSFPLLVRRDTFQVIVRAVDNTFLTKLNEHDIVRFSPVPYCDFNGNGQYDVGEELPTLSGAIDRNGAYLGMPLLNQPPSVVFAPDPNDPANTMQQPETTFTVATFSWVGSDPDGDQTIISYDIALNDTSAADAWLTLSGKFKLVTLAVPRERSDTASGETDADVYTGTYATTKLALGTVHHLRLDSLNTFYVRARDVAGDLSPVIQLPASPRTWFVKRPRGRLLLVSDYLGSGTAGANVRAFYRSKFAQIASENGGKFGEFEVLDIAQGLTVSQKRNSKIGALVPPFIDPAFLGTLHLFDVVIWYTDQIPSLAVAQYPLFEYVRDSFHRGKVIFTTMFENAIDPRGALKDFAPIDSISSVNLIATRLLPTLGDSQIPPGFSLFPDSSDPANVYPPLTFSPSRGLFSVYMRPIYKRADARYIYRMQEDQAVPGVRPSIGYVFVPTLGALKSVAAIGSQAWTCGENGIILSTTNSGENWIPRQSGTTNSLNGLQFLDPSTGWIIGDGGTILRTDDGGVSWTNLSVLTLETPLGLWFISKDTGFVVGTKGFLIRTTNGGSSWTSPASNTTNTLRSIHFIDSNTGVAVGDSGVIIKTTNGGVNWKAIPKITRRRLTTVRFRDSQFVVAFGDGGLSMRSARGGDTLWTVQPNLFYNVAFVDVRSAMFLDATTGWLSGSNGLLFSTHDGGLTWQPTPAQGTIITQPNGDGQILNCVAFGSASEGWAVGTSGIILHTTDGGLTSSTQPKGALNVGVIDGIGPDGKRSFMFLGLPLHVLDGTNDNAKLLLERVLFQEFGL